LIGAQVIAYIAGNAALDPIAGGATVLVTRAGCALRAAAKYRMI
jgi:hypothetical protein